MTTNEALEKVFAELRAMTPEEFQNELDKHKNSDIACAFRELQEFEQHLQDQSDGLQ